MLKIKSFMTPELKISTEDLDGIFDISALSEEDVPEEEIVEEEETTEKPIELEETEHGSLVSVESLMIDEDEHISTEDIKLLQNNNECPPQMQDIKGKTLFVKDENNINAYLCGRCDDTFDYIIHMLAHATENVNINIMFSCPGISVCDSLELIGAISATKAKVTVYLICANSVIDLLLLTIDNIDVKINNGLQIQHCASYAYGSYFNIETILDFIKNYYSMVYDTLLEKGILTKEEISKLKKKGEMIFISKKDILSRLSK